jgi:flagellar M-ring protein FliF
VDVAALFTRLQRLTPPIRIAFAAAGALVFLGAIVTGLIAKPQRVALFAEPLHSEQVTEVEEQLAGWNIPYTLRDGNVAVESKARNNLLLRLSMVGVPHAHIDGSNDVLGKLGALTPQSVIDAQTRDALAGDIELALRGVEGVQDARIIIAPAKQGYFADDVSRDASASVRLRLTPGARLSTRAISGIRAFVAASVAGLQSRNVTIVDDHGLALGDGGGEDDATDLQSSLQGALDAAIGPGNAIVRVTVDYDRTAVTSRDTRRTPLLSTPISSDTVEERYAGEDKRYNRTQRRMDGGSDTHEVTTSASPGRIARISVAVLVDAARVSDVASVRSLASAALGLDRSRGDQLEVRALNFAHAKRAKRDALSLAYDAIAPLLPTLFIVAGALMALHKIAAPLSAFVSGLLERRSIAKASNAARAMSPANVRGVLLHEPPHAAAAIISALPAATAAAVLDMYPEHERAAIVRRMQRPQSPLLPDTETFVAHA